MKNRRHIGSINDEFIATVARQLGANESLRYQLADEGELHIDRQLPFLCLYRRPTTTADSGTDALITGQAAYLKITTAPAYQNEISKLLQAIISTQSRLFGGFLIIEVWAGETAEEAVHAPAPVFHIHAPTHNAPDKLLDTFENALQRIKLRGRSARVYASFDNGASPPGRSPIVSTAFAAEHHCLVLGLEVKPVYREMENTLPYALREIRGGLTPALKKVFYRFSHDQTRYQPRHYHELGSRALTKAVWETDQRLAQISENFDLLLHVTPVNAAQAWEQFKESGYSQTPEFHYRPRSTDPALLKRALYHVPLERIKDPGLADLFASKRDELDRQLTLLNDRNTFRFLHGSIQLFGQVDDELLSTAQHLIAQPATPPAFHDSSLLDAEAFAQQARMEMDHYRKADPGFTATVEVRDDITGILVSHGNFLIGSDAQVSSARLSASLHHEIGTHALTYHNGKMQPFHQLYAGMAGYEELQEGLAVLAEYLAGGLDLERLQLLAGRVVAVHSMISGAKFIETFEHLHKSCRLGAFTAFTTTMRAYRGGGYTKDMIYLRGLINVIKHIAKEEELELLYCGKIALQHLPLLQELRWREVIKPIALTPRVFETAEAMHRLDSLRANPNIEHMIGNVT